MSTQTETPAGPQPNSSLYIIGMLSLVSTICGVVIVAAYLLTREPIARNLAIITNAAVKEVVSGGEKQAIYAVKDGQVKRVEGLSGPEQKLFAVYGNDGKLVAVAVQAQGTGYGDLISIMYAYSPDKQAIIGYKLLDAKETPGLGDKIGYDPDFLSNFQSLEAKPGSDGLQNAIHTVKHGTKSNPWEIDGITGATISSTAVGKTVNESAQKMVPLIERNIEQIRKGE